MASTTRNQQALIDFLGDAGRPVRASELQKAGFSRVMLHRLAASGDIERSARGVYSLPERDHDERQDWAAITVAVPEAVICMQTAAVYHGITQNLAGAVDVAVPAGRSVPALSFDSVSINWTRWSREEALHHGVITIGISGVQVKITDPERTLVDLFRYSSLAPQRRIPTTMVDDETAIEAMTRYFRANDDPSSSRVLEMARIFGVEERMKPYLLMVTSQHLSLQP